MRFFVLLSLFFTALFSKEQVDFLFYLQDAGETNALLPVIEDLDRQGFRIALLAGGTAVDLVHGRKVWTFADFGMAKVDKSWPRDGRLEVELLERLACEIEPAAVITGVAFEAQGQVLGFFADKPTFAYWDNFNSTGENPYFQTARKVAQIANTLLIPTSEIAGDFEGASQIRVVGQPTLGEWRKKIGAFKEDGPAVFIGGYGADYEEAFRLFLDCAAASGRSFAVQIHPKCDGSFERAEIAKRSEIDVWTLPIGFSTIEAVGKAPLVVCHQSTVGFQAMSCGKPVIHVIPEGQKFESLPLNKGLAFNVFNPDSFLTALAKAERIPFETFDELMGIPPDSVSRITAALIEAIPFHCGTK